MPAGSSRRAPRLRTGDLGARLGLEGRYKTSRPREGFLVACLQRAGGVEYALLVCDRVQGS